MTGAGVLRLGTRRSLMAMEQSRQVAAAITRLTGRDIELVGITSRGDVSAEQLTQIGGTGVFVSALRTALLAGDVDFAVHSLKDLPTGPAEGIALAAVPVRDDPRDALIARGGAKLADLPRGARIGTGSPRRAAQLLLLRADLLPVPVRGNADTRLAKVESGDLDAVVLGHAGLGRIGRLDAVTQLFEPDEMLPAAGQGALAVECPAAGKTSLRCWPAWMTRSAGRRRPRNAACSARFRRAARPRWARMLPGRMYFGSAAWWSQPTGGALRGSASGAPAMAEAIGQR